MKPPGRPAPVPGSVDEGGCPGALPGGDRAAATAPLRIAFLTHSFNPRGGVVHTLELARALHLAGQQVTVFAPAAAGERLFRQVPYTVERVDAPVTPPGRVTAMVEARIAAFERHLQARLDHRPLFDIYHAQDPIGANALANLQERGRIPGFVRTVHHLDEFADDRLAAWQRRGHERAARVLCVSRLWQQVLRDGQPSIAALQVANGVDCDRYARFEALPGAGRDDAARLAALGLRRGTAAGEPVFLAVGGIEARKNSLRILQAFLLIRRRWPRAQLVVAGGASLLDHDRCASEFHAAAAAVGLRTTGPDAPLLLTGPLPDDAMPALMRRADALVTPSLREGFGLVVLEALACGTPVVVSRIPPFTEYLGDADCCWADPLDPASIAEAMAAALDPQRVAALARAVPEVCRRFNWPASAARHLEIYRSLIDSPAGSRSARRAFDEGSKPRLAPLPQEPEPEPEPSAPTLTKEAPDARHALPPALAGCQ